VIRACDQPGCSTLTLGPLCLAHELPVTRTFPRGRPYRPASLTVGPELQQPVGVGDPQVAASVGVHDSELVVGPVG